MFGWLFKRKTKKREIVVNVEKLETRVAVVENGRVEEFQVEHPMEERLVGCVFKGRIQNLEHDLQAAFVDIGLKKNAFLHYWDMLPDESGLLDEEEGGRQSRRRRISNEEIEKRFPPGSDIVVQVTKGPIGTKGPRVTANLSLPGRYLVMMPSAKATRGVSRKIADGKERLRLKKILDRLPLPPGVGIIVRTVGSGATVQGQIPAAGTLIPGKSEVVLYFGQDAPTDTVEVPDFSGDPYVVIDDNQPDFPAGDMTTESFETYSPLDALGRCGVAWANVGVDLMPTEDRESISSVTPSGWINREYDGEYLYNRCHLIGFQLTGENANEENLITGTRYMNVDGMLPFENLAADYIRETGNHVLYRVTPVFEDRDLVASGVQMEAWSVEDSGEGVCFNVYVYNVQPGIVIDYATGESWQEGEAPPEDGDVTYILNTSSRKFHYPDCAGVATMSDANKETWTGSREDLMAEGYEPCGQCRP